MKRDAKAISNAMVTDLQNKVYDTLRDLQIRKDRGDNIIDTYEYGFIMAMKEVEKVYNLGIDFLQQ